MSGRFEGAITTPDEEEPDSAAPPSARAPAGVRCSWSSRRPSSSSAASPPSSASLQQLVAPACLPMPACVLLIAAVDLAAFAIGLLIRAGRWWRLCINVVAIAMFLYLTRFSNPIAVLYFILDTVVFYALMRHRAWFDWVRRPVTEPS